jgi:hypothetical protein
MSGGLRAGRPGCTPPVTSREAQKEVYPGWTLEQWLTFAKRLCKLGPGGRIGFDYDMRIAEPFRIPGGATGFDLERAFSGLQGIPPLSFAASCRTCSPQRRSSA